MLKISFKSSECGPFLLPLDILIIVCDFYLECRAHLERHIASILTDPRFCIRRHSLLEEVVLILQRDALHEIEGVRCIVNLRVAQLEREAVRHELDILCHELRVHANQLARQSLCDELLLNLHGLAKNLVRLLLRETVHELGIQETGEIRVDTLVACNELIGERQAGHNPPLLKPEDGAKGTAEEDTLYRCESE